MKPFDLEKALAGEPVITRDGVEVTELYYFKTLANPGSEYPVRAVVAGSIHAFTKAGEHISGLSKGLDLFMAPKIIRKWVNLYPCEVIVFPPADCVDGNLHNTEKEADADAEACPGRIGNRAFLIEWEE